MEMIGLVKCDDELVVMLSYWAPRRGASRLCKCVRLHNQKEPWYGYMVDVGRVERVGIITE